MFIDDAAGLVIEYFQLLVYERMLKMKKTKAFSLSVLAAFLVLLALCFGVSAASAPQQVGKLKIVAESNSVLVTWDKIPDADGYRVYLVEDGKITDYKTLKEPSHEFKNLKPNSSYSVRARAYILTGKDGKEKLFGKYSEYRVFKTKLSSPTGLKVKKATSDSLAMTWNAVKNANKYYVCFAPTGSSNYKVIAETKKTSYTVKNLDGKSGYKIRIRAVSDDNLSRMTPVTAFYTIPKKPTGLKAKSKTPSSVELSWNSLKPSDGYRVYAATSKDGKLKYLGTTKKTGFTYSKGESETVYYFSVRAIIKTENQSIYGELSNRVRGKTGKFTATLSKSTVRKGEYLDVKLKGAKSSKLSSSNTSVLKVEKGRLHAVGTGSAVVTVKSGKSKVKLNVKVNPPVMNYMSCVYDVTKGQMLFGNRMNERCYPASITKLITALVALKYMSVDSTIVVGSELNMVEPLSSRCGIYQGEKFRLGDLLYGLLLPSGGDAAYTIAVNCARKVSGNPNMGYVAAKNYFAGLMNSYMKSIGATGTHCVNPHGYPVSGHYSTVHDLLLVAQKVLQNKTLSRVTSTYGKYITALTGRGRYWKTTNGLIIPGGSRYNRYSHGMKTGTVNDNYTGIISAATTSKHTVITVVIGCESYGARYDATQRLYNYYL